jgi:hypothetical protein
MDREFTFDEVGLAGEYLFQAIDALLATGDRTKLGLDAPRKHQEGRDAWLEAFGRRQKALKQRMAYCRDSILFVSERFDRTGAFPTVKRLHQEDFAQLTGRLPIHKLRGKWRPVGRRVSGGDRRGLSSAGG